MKNASKWNQTYLIIIIYTLDMLASAEIMCLNRSVYSFIFINNGLYYILNYDYIVLTHIGTDKW